MFNDFTKFMALMNTSHLFSEHVGMDGLEMRKVGPIQYAIHWFYGVSEPTIFRVVNILLDSRWVKHTRSGKFFLRQLARLSWYFPHGLIVTTEAAERMIDFVVDTEGPKGARLAVGPCVCQRALGIWQEPCKKDIVILYGADIYTHLNLGYELLDRDQVKAILRQCNTAGLVHSIDFCLQSGKWTFVICNCETEICIPARIYKYSKRFFYQGPEDVVHDAEKCLGAEACGRCLTRCLWGVNKANPDGSIAIDSKECLGCGLCVSTCIGKARHMIARKNYKHEKVLSTKILLGEHSSG